jgi:phage-related protein
MPDTIGGVTVPTVAASGVFPITVDFGVVVTIAPQIVTHQFGAGNAKREQRFYLGPGAREWQISQEVDETERVALRNFWEARQGSYQPFTFNAPLEDGTTETVTAQFKNEPLTWDNQVGLTATIQVNLIEVNTGDGPTYTLTSTSTRFPSVGLATQLEGQQITLVPLVKIQPRASGYPAIYVSDRRCTLGSQLYQARLLRWEGIGQVAVGLPATDPESDDVTLVFGNADRVMRMLADDVLLDYARVEFSLFEPTTGIKLDLWAGEIVTGGWISSPGPEFTIHCSDPLNSPFMVCPDRMIDRKCQAIFNTLPQCPFASVGALDTTHYPSADASFCDRGYDTDNGCLAHGMARYFRGVLAVPQGVRVKDNTTGFAGFGRSAITSVSLVADSVYGQPIPEIYTNIQMPVTAMIIAGRDEGDFYEALGIVGEGPLGSYGVGNTLDGQLNHGWPGSLGLHLVVGSDPAGAGDWLSLDQSGDQTGGDFRKVFSGNSTYLNNYTAGLAFAVIRRTDAKGLQLTTLDEHSMQVVIMQGMSGWIWTAPGSRTTGVLTNPVWVTINRYLRTLGLNTADTATQEAVFDVPSAIAGAAVCDTTVDRLVGDPGSETQYEFIGRIQDIRPLRDWLNDILLNCLGHYSFAFGKLRIGVRTNSSSAAAFTAGNMIWRSLQLQSAGARFNRLSMSYADPLLDQSAPAVVNGGTVPAVNQFVPNTVVYQDDDAALELGGGGRTIYQNAQMNLVGTANISQGQRIVITRGREEVGGVTADDRKKARRAVWQTSVLALDVEPGMVVSITDPEMPGGSGELRVERWKLNPDYSIELTGRSTVDAMYDLTIGPKPADVIPPTIDPEFQPVPLQPAWCPFQEFPLAGDPLIDVTEGTFGLDQEYTKLTDGSQQMILAVTGQATINDFIPDTVPPLIRSYALDASAGSLDPSQNYWLSVCARRDDPDGSRYTPPSNIIAFTGAKKVTLDDLAWPAGTFDGYSLFASVGTDKTICRQVDFTGDLPATIDFSGPLLLSTFNMPSPAYMAVRAKAALCIHAGRVGVQVSAVATNSLTCAALAGLGDDWTDSDVTVIADQSDGSAPPWDFHCTAWDDSTGTFTLTPDPLAAGVEVLDPLTIRCVATAATSTSITDAKLVSGVYPHGLLLEDPGMPGSFTIADGEKGAVIRIRYGTGRGQVRRATANTADTYSIDPPWDIVPDSTSRFTVEHDWSYFGESKATKNQIAVPIKIPIVCDNLAGETFTVGGFIIDRNGNETPEANAVIREIYCFGVLGNSAAIADGFFAMPIVSDHASPDLANGLNQKLVLNQATRVTIDDPVFTGGTIQPGSWMAIYILQDATGSRPTPAWGSAFGSDISAAQLDPKADTRSAINLTYHDDGKWHLDSFNTGLQ